MFIGARVAYVRAGVARFGVVIKDNADFSYLVKLDDLTEITVSEERLTLINYWKTLKRGMDVGDYKTFPKNTDPKIIFLSKKAVIFGQAGMRAIWYYYNHVIFNDKMKEPKFLVTKGRGFGRYSWGNGKPATISVSERCHSLFEVTNTIVHEQIHEANIELEHANYSLEGAHGASFLRWIPIIKEKTGITVTITGDAAKDETEHDEDTVAKERKTTPFIFLIFKLKENKWYGIWTDKIENLSGLEGTASSWIGALGVDSHTYAGISDLSRVKAELIAVKGRNFPKSFKVPLSTGLVNLLAKTCRPINGYRPSVEIQGDLNE